jgi:hypothetical protein
MIVSTGSPSFRVSHHKIQFISKSNRRGIEREIEREREEREIEREREKREKREKRERDTVPSGEAEQNSVPVLLASQTTCAKLSNKFPSL